MKMENDILKDVQVILSAQGEELDKIRDVLEGEQVFMESEVLKYLADEKGVQLFRNTLTDGKDIDYVTDKIQLMMDLMENGAPEISELSNDVKRLRREVKFNSTQEKLKIDG